MKHWFPFIRMNRKGHKLGVDTMNPFLAFLIRSTAAIPSAITIWLLSFFAFNNPFLLSSAISLASGALIYWFVSIYTDSLFLKKNGLTRKEFRYIKKNLDEAKRKISRLQKLLFSIRHRSTLKERVELLRIIRKIYGMTKKEPKRFYQAERFYFSHLDSVLELTEKYAFLSSQPKKNWELDQSLYETRETLSEMGKLVEKDLYQVLENDIEHLNFEIDVAKYSIKTQKDSKNETVDYRKPLQSTKDKKPDVPLPRQANTANAASEPKKSTDTSDAAYRNWVKQQSNEKSGAAKEKHTIDTRTDVKKEEISPRYSINTKTEEKVEVKVPLKPSQESNYQDENRRSN